MIFWHGRTVHSAGIHLGQDVRWALFADYAQDLPVLSDDDTAALAARVLAQEHRLLPHVVGLFASQRVLLRDDAQVIFDGHVIHEPLQLA